MKNKRFSEIDAIRGLAVLAMIIYHVLFDLSTLNLLEIRIGTPILEITADVTAATFFTVVGVSLYISYYRSRSRYEGILKLSRKYLIRAAKLLAMGGIITGITFFLYPELVVIFGALQFIAVAIFLGYLGLELTYSWKKSTRITFLILVSAIIFVLSGRVRAVRVDYPFLLWLGVIPSGFQSLDYFPLFPWLGYVIGGLALGDLLYPGGKRKLEFYSFGNEPAEFFGRHALVLYFLHQPLIYLGIIVFSFISGGSIPFS